MKRRRKTSAPEQPDSARLLGLIFAAAALAVLLLGILSPSRLGTIDNGRYAQTMEAAGLEFLPEDPDALHSSRVVERYGYGKFSYWRLLAPSGDSSILYPIALVRILTQPFGIPFSTQYLAVVYALLFAAGVYMLVRGSCFLGGWMGAIPGGLMLLAASSGNLIACMNSLYTIATAVVGLLLLAGTAIRLFTYGRERLGASLALFLAAAAFCLNASPLCLLFAPAVVLAGLAAIVPACREGRLRPESAAFVALILAACVFSSAQYQRTNPDIQSDASAYHAAFIGLLETSDDPGADLTELGLDESYLPDIGKSFYLPEGDYAHCPRQNDALFAALSSDAIGGFYLRHPARLYQTANRQAEQYNHFDSGAAARVDGNAQISRVWSTAEALLKMLLSADCTSALLLLAALLASAVWVGLRLRRQGAAFALPAALALGSFGAGCFLYVPMHLRYMGRDFLAGSRIVCVFGMLLGIGCVCLAGGDLVRTLSVWFRAGQESPVARDDLSEFRIRLPASQPRLPIRRIAENRTVDTFCVFLLALAMSAIIQLMPLRAGCVNSGDFWRMMEHLGLTWQEPLRLDYAAQVNHLVIENYAYSAPFDWKSLTFLSPKYSLIYPASLVRLISFLTGQDFSTWYMAMIMNAVLVLCIVSITHDLHDVLGRYSLLLGGLLCAVFLGEGSLVWLNSLYGEGSILLGTFMVIACCIHMAVRPAGRGWLTVFPLMFSVRFLLCAKAQMLVALPFALALIVLLGVHQRPRPIVGKIFYALAVLAGCALICVESVTVYRDNADISERQTVWQSTFYGALMISDDPEAAMDELGIDRRMQPDIGKHAYFPDEDYVISPNSREADAALFDHVNTFTMVKYYLRHPGQLWYMLNRGAQASKSMYTGFRAYLGQDYSQSCDPVRRFGIWEFWRSFFTFGSFLGYVLLYGALIAICIFGILRRKSADTRLKLLALVYLGIMLIGAVQYPLSVVGNGFADNHKQMYGFMLCHDFLTMLNLAAGFCFLARRGAKGAGRRRQECRNT